jgi:hypothetical protein
MTIIEERAAQLPTLKYGAHSPDSGEMCLLEAAAWVAGEPWSDHPGVRMPRSLQPHVEALQASAVDLYQRMIDAR